MTFFTFLNIKKYFPRTEKNLHILLHFWCFEINTWPINLCIFHSFRRMEISSPQHWKITRNFIAFLVLSDQYMTNEPMIFLLFFERWKYPHPRWPRSQNKSVQKGVLAILADNVFWQYYIMIINRRKYKSSKPWFANTNSAFEKISLQIGYVGSTSRTVRRQNYHAALWPSAKHFPETSNEWETTWPHLHSDLGTSTLCFGKLEYPLVWSPIIAFYPDADNRQKQGQNVQSSSGLFWPLKIVIISHFFSMVSHFIHLGMGVSKNKIFELLAPLETVR